MFVSPDKSLLNWEPWNTPREQFRLRRLGFCPRVSSVTLLGGLPPLKPLLKRVAQLWSRSFDGALTGEAKAMACETRCRIGFPSFREGWQSLSHDPERQVTE